MTKSRIAFAALTVLLIALAIGWLARSGKVAYFKLDKRLRIEVNGVPVKGEIIGNKSSAIVTIRESGKKHSYQLFYEGDVDSTGDTGFVVDCQQWLAPEVPFLLQTHNYPPCKRHPEDEYGRWSLVLRSGSMQFATKDHSTVRIVPSD